MSILSSCRTPVLPGVGLVGGGLTPSLLTCPTSPNLMHGHAESRTFGYASRGRPDANVALRLTFGAGKALDACCGRC